MFTFTINLSLKHKDFFKIRTGADETLASHLVVFAAEKARKENRVVTINEDMSFAWLNLEPLYSIPVDMGCENNIP